MTTDWDKLWETEPDIHYLFVAQAEHYELITEMTYNEWKRQVRDEGDKLQNEVNKLRVTVQSKFWENAYEDVNKERLLFHEKLEAIRELLRNAPVPPEEIPDLIMELLGDESK